MTCENDKDHCYHRHPAKDGYAAGEYISYILRCCFCGWELEDEITEEYENRHIAAILTSGYAASFANQKHDPLDLLKIVAAFRAILEELKKEPS